MRQHAWKLLGVIIPDLEESGEDMNHCIGVNSRNIEED